MTIFKASFVLMILLNAFIFSNAQQANKKFQFGKIIYHSSRCNGSCPQIDLVIEKNKEVYVARQMFKSKSEVDQKYSGTFNGSLKQNEYNKLITLLEAAQLDSLQFPMTYCCDGAIKTLIVYYNGKRRYFKSMAPPESVAELLKTLSAIAINKKLKTTKIKKTIEE